MAKHGMMEDVAAVIGFTAATTLVDWFGGFGQLYIPAEAGEDHPIGRVIGMPAFKQLVKLFEGVKQDERFLWFNNGDNRETARRDRLIACLMAVGGLGSRQIATITGMAESSVRFSQLRVERLGILPMLLRRAGLEKAGVVNPMAMVTLKSQGSAARSAEKKPAGNARQKSQETPTPAEDNELLLFKVWHKRPPAKKGKSRATKARVR